jgi:hypothetical protein
VTAVMDRYCSSLAAKPVKKRIEIARI